MKIKILRCRIFIVFILPLLFSSQLSFAELKPIAASVKEKHDLNIAFRSYGLFQNSNDINEPALLEALSSGTTAEIIPGKLSGLVRQKPDAITIDIPFNRGTITVELVSVNILTEDFSVVTGENKIVPYTPGAYYRGIIKDKPNSLASFSFFNDELYGVISDDVNGNIVVGRVTRQGNINEYVIYSDRNLLQPFNPFCKTAEDPSQEERIRNLKLSPVINTVKCVRFYYEVDHDIYVNKSSSVVNTTNWMTAVHNNVQTLYANDNITIALSQVYVWSTTDPYTGTNSSGQLALFRSTRVSFNGDVAQLVAHDANNGGLAASINGLCLSSKYSYADVDYTYSNVLTYSWTVEVVTHEFGHVLGSPHTHNCSWPGGAIDNCGPNAGYPTEGGCANGPTPVNGGTIMSYCHLTGVGINFSNGFGPFPAAAIQTAVNAASCLGASCAACPVPAHNECGTPAILNVTTNCVYTSASLCAATQSIAPITCNNRTAAHGYDVWYSVTPSQTSMVINCQSGTSTDVVLGLYSGGCGNLSLVSCADATTNGGLETINASSLTAGATYYVRVYDYNGATTGTDFGICASQSCQAAANNSCGNATALNIGSSCNYISGDLCSATQSISPASCSNYTAPTALDLWYTITPNQNNVRVTCLSGVNTDIVIGVYSGVCGSLNLVKCVDSTGNGGIEILNVGVTAGTTYYVRVYDWGGNQFGTDFQLCAQYLCTPPNSPTGASAVSPTICAGGSTALNVTGTLSAGATWKWYSASCGGTAAGTGASITVSPSATTAYYVRAETGTCYSNCSSVGVVVTPIPAAATTATSVPSTICSGTTSTITVTGTLSAGATWKWYTASCGGTAAGTGTSITVSPVTPTTYFVRAENGSCYSACKNTAVAITNSPSAPTAANASPASVCAGTSSSLSVTGNLSSGATWRWYSGTCGGTPAGTGTSLSVTPTVTTTYFVRAENGNCFSSCQSTTITVTPIPSNPTAANASATSVCAGSSSTLSVTGTLSSGATWRWHSGTCGGTSVGTGASISVSPSSTTTYFVRAENGSCYSSCQSVSVAVTSIPSNSVAAGASPSSICSGASSTLSVAGILSSGAIWVWYSASCGGTAVGTGASVSVSPVSNTTYFVRAENGSCFSACRSVSVNVTTVQNPTAVHVSSASICAGSNSTISVSGNLSAGAAWHWYTGSCGGAAAGTGSSISVSPTSTTSYFVRAENGSCNSACQTTNIAVTAIPANPITASASPATVCGGSSSTLTVTGTLSSGASWRWYSGSCGGNSVGSGTTASVSPSSTRTYYVRAENGNCYSACETTSVSVSPTPSDPTSATPSFALICEGDFSTLTVAGTLSSGASWQWYSASCGGTLEGTGASLNVSPSSTTRYYVRAENGNCYSGCKNTTINVLPSPGIPQPVNATSSDLCDGESALLTENGTLSSGGDWYWYTGSCGGTPVGQGVSLSISPASNQTYYVRAENTNCQSSCVNLVINVYPRPVSPTIAIGNDTLYIQFNQNYEWFWSSDKITFNFSGNDQILPLTKNGYYFVVVTDANGCTASSDTVHYTTTSITKPVSENIISVYPNPFNDVLNIELSPAVLEDAELKIFDDTGRLIYYDRLSGNKTNIISLAQYADGIYQLVFSVKGKIFTEKVLKQ